MNSFNAFFSGFSLGLSLILAIGAQNAFVLKQGIKKRHIFLVCAICALSDATLIFAGVSGFGYVVERYPIIKTAALWGGFVFLSIYGVRSLYSAFSTSHAFFFLPGYGARFLAPLFQKPAAWKILEFFVGVTMMALGAMLVIG